MIKITKLIEFLDSYLLSEKFHDYGPNGLQVQGKSEVKKIALAVSSDLETIRAAAKWRADALLVHHGLIWKGQVRPLVNSFGERFQHLFKNEINLIAYHLPLDAHLECGNASGIMRRLGYGYEEIKPFYGEKLDPLGVQAKLKKPLPLDQIQKKLAQVLDHQVLCNLGNGSKKKIASIGIITGGASSYWTQALRGGIDLFISGEIKEYDWFESKENGVAFLAGGHYATEQFGVQDLGTEIQRQFKNVELRFFPSYNLA